MIISKIKIFLKLIKLLIIRNIYRKTKIKIFYPFTSTNLHEKNAEIFFGYYDLCPFNPKNEKIVLACKTKIKQKTNIPIQIGFFNLDDKIKKFNKLSTSKAWCWQQGCRLRWLNEKTIIYNDLIDNTYRAVIRNVKENKIKKIIKFPIYDVLPQSQMGLSLNFSRLENQRPGYGYNALIDEWEDSLYPEYDGIWSVNLKTNKQKLIFSLKDAHDFKFQESMKNSIHYFNHISWNPNGTRLLVFHIWHKKNKQRNIRVLTMNKDGSDTFLLTDENYASHYWWINNKKILLYSSKNGIKCFNLYDDKQGFIKSLNNSILKSDGHPSFNKRKSLMLSDTLLDRFNERNLYIYSVKNKTKKKVGDFYSPPQFTNDYKCDLHPRWSQDNMISVDSSHLGYRNMLIIKSKNLKFSDSDI